MQMRPRDRAAQALGMPYDTAMGFPVIHSAGNLRIRLENHKGVRTMSETLMEFATPRGIVRFSGKELSILKMDRDEVTVSGILDTIDLSGLR